MPVIWTVERVDTLLNGFESGLKNLQLAALIGTTVAGIKAKLAKLGQLRDEVPDRTTKAQLVVANKQFLSLLRMHHPERAPPRKPLPKKIKIVAPPKVEIVPEPPPPPPMFDAPTGHEICEIVCRFYDIRKVEIMSPRRTDVLARARRIVSKLCIEFTTLSLPGIGKILCRDHTTILHGLRELNKTLTENQQLSDEMNVLRGKIRARWDIGDNAFNNAEKSVAA